MTTELLCSSAVERDSHEFNDVGSNPTRALLACPSWSKGMDLRSISICFRGFEPHC